MDMYIILLNLFKSYQKCSDANFLFVAVLLEIFFSEQKKFIKYDQTRSKNMYFFTF